MATKNKDFKFEITEEMIQRAERYIPISQKVAFAETYAPECLRQVSITTQKLQSDTILALPQLYEESTLMKQLILMQGFLTLYLHIDTGDEFTANKYDLFASFHPMNQLERLKTNPNIKDKVFDILADYKELKKIFEVELYNRKSTINDSVERILAGVAVINDPETLKKVMEELKKAELPKAQPKKAAEEKTEA